MKNFRTVFSYYLKKQIIRRSFILSTLFVVFLSYALYFAMNSEIFKVKNTIINIIDRTSFFTNDLENFNNNKSGYEFILKENKSDSAIKQDVIDTDESYLIFDFNNDNTVKLTMICNDEADSTGYSIALEKSNIIHKKVLAKQLSLTDEQYNSMTQEIASEVILADSTHNDTFIVAYLCIFILAISIMMYGGKVSDEVAYCKTNRVMDLMLTSVSPKIIFFGVTVATGLVGLIQLVFIIGNMILGYYIIRPEIVVIDSLVIDFSIITPDVIIVYLALFILGYLLYAFIYAGISSMINNPEDVSSAILPVTLLASMEMIVALYSLSFPKTMLTKICSYIPLTSSTTMFSRYIAGNAGVESVLATLMILVISIIIITIVSSKMFRFGSTYYGNIRNLAKFKSILKK